MDKLAFAATITVATEMLGPPRSDQRSNERVHEPVPVQPVDAQSVLKLSVWLA